MSCYYDNCIILSVELVLLSGYSEELYSSLDVAPCVLEGLHTLLSRETHR